MRRAGELLITFPPISEWPLYVNDDGRVACAAGCDPEWTATGRRVTLTAVLNQLAEHVRAEHPDGPPSCT
jgi:hypothetical protein